MSDTHDWKSNDQGIYVVMSDGSKLYLAVAIHPGRNARKMRQEMICRRVNSFDDLVSTIEKTIKASDMVVDCELRDTAKYRIQLRYALVEAEAVLSNLKGNNNVT